MAVIRYSGLVDQLRGKLNGTVFSRFNAGFNSYKKGQPKRIGSRSQQLMRQNISLASQSWRTVTPGDRAVWASKAALFPVLNRFGEPVTLSPYNYFMKFQLMRSAAGFPQMLTPQASNTIPSPTQILAATMTVTQQGNRYLITDLSIQNARSGSATGTGIQQFSISYPYPVAGTAYDSTFFYAARTPVQINVPGIPGHLLQYTDILMPEGWSTWNGAHHLIRLDVWSDTRMIHREPVYYELQSVFQPPAPQLTNTFSNAADPYGQYWDITGSAETYPTYQNIYNQTRINEYPPGDPTDYEFVQDVLLQAQTTNTPDPSLFDNPYKTFTTPGSWNSANPNMAVTTMPSPTFANWLNTDPRTPNPVDFRWIHTRVKIRRLSDGAESGWSYLQWRPVHQ